jgi:VanZ family protein
MTIRGKSTLAIYWLALLAWTGVVWFLSSRPSVPTIGSGAVDLSWKQGGHLLLHFVLFLLAWLAGASTWGRTRGMIFALVYAFANALLDEVYQTILPQRNANLEDALTNSAGVLLGLIVVWGWQVRFRTDAEH